MENPVLLKAGWRRPYVRLGIRSAGKTCGCDQAERDHPPGNPVRNHVCNRPLTVVKREPERPVIGPALTGRLYF